MGVTMGRMARAVGVGLTVTGILSHAAVKNQHRTPVNCKVSITQKFL